MQVLVLLMTTIFLCTPLKESNCFSIPSTVLLGQNLTVSIMCIRRSSHPLKRFVLNLKVVTGPENYTFHASSSVIDYSTDSKFSISFFQLQHLVENLTQQALRDLNDLVPVDDSTSINLSWFLTNQDQDTTIAPSINLYQPSLPAVSRGMELKSQR